MVVKFLVPLLLMVAVNGWTEDDSRILEVGEISTPAYIAGATVGTIGWLPGTLAGGWNSPVLWTLLLPGFGVGQLIQGRYQDTGWIFTLGELGSAGVALAAGALFCDHHGDFETCGIGALALGALVYLPFRALEVFDLWSGPPIHNAKYQKLKDSKDSKVDFRVIPTLNQSHADRQGALNGVAGFVVFHL